MNQKKLKSFIIALVLVIATIIVIYLATSDESLDIRNQASGGETITVCFNGGADCDFDYENGDDKQAIQSAIDLAQDGDTVQLEEGIYEIDSYINQYDNYYGTAAGIGIHDSITLKGAGLTKTIIKGLKDWNTYGIHVGLLTISESEDFKIEELTLISKGKSVPAIYTYSSQGEIHNNLLKAPKHLGLYIDESSDVEIKNNIVTECQYFGIFVEKSDAVIKNNIVFRNNDQGITSFPESTIEIINNTIVENGLDPEGVSYGAVSIMRRSSANIINNIIANNRNYGIFNDSDRSWAGEYINDYNNVFQNEQGNYSDVEPGENSISEDPEFYEDDSYLYLLKDTSSSVDSGDPSIEDPSSNGIEADFPAKGSKASDIGAYGGPDTAGWEPYLPFPAIDPICSNDADCEPDCEGYHMYEYLCRQGDCVYGSDLKCSAKCGAECTTNNVGESECADGFECNFDSCKCEIVLPTICGTNESCKPPCDGKKRLSYSCLRTGAEGFCVFGEEPTCNKDCGAECTKDGDCTVGKCNLKACTCESTTPPPVKNCEESDIWGPLEKPDDKVSAYDLSLILSNWKWQKTPKDEQADIWGTSQKADGNVNAYDLSKVLGCWTKK
ncbi:MAG: right-handed parallel beta-helix repeat-containing protein [Patescibacteria group bacterium]|nr:right-handed parallel beta-helix repeat-containing protein [Patescibacteria group bacterium]